MLMCLLLGILVLSGIGTGGYYACKKIQVSNSVDHTTKTATQSINKLVQTPGTSSRCHASIPTQTTQPTRVEAETTSNAVSRTSKTRHESIQRHITSTTLIFTSAITSSNDQTSTASIGTSGSSQTRTLTSITQTRTLTRTTSTSTLTRTTSTDMTTVSTTTTPLTIRTTAQSTMNNDPTSDLPPLCSPTSHNYCECAAAEGTWTVIQKRFDGSVDFYRSWTEYKEGFGDENGEFWLGNDAIHQMTSSANYSLKIYVTDWNNITKYALYDTFKIADEADGYNLTIGGYCGDAEDSMIRHHNGRMFSTKDRDNDNSGMHCAQSRHGAWWYHNCGNANLNGRYYYDNSNLRVDGINWLDWYLVDRSTGHSLEETTMMIKRVP